MINKLKSYYSGLPNRLRYYLFFLIFLIIAITTLEFGGLVMIYWLLNAFSTGEYEKTLLVTLVLGDNLSLSDFYRYAGLITVATFLIAGCVRYIFLHVQSGVLMHISQFHAARFYRNSYNSPYIELTGFPDSRFVAMLTTKLTALVFEFYLPIMSIISGVVSLLMLILAASVVDMATTFFVLAAVTLVFIVLYQTVKAKSNESGFALGKGLPVMVGKIQDSNHARRHIYIDGLLDWFVSEFLSAEKIVRRAQTTIYRIGSLPKLIMETMLYSLIGLLAVFAGLYPAGFAENLVSIVFYGIVGQRMIPVGNSIFSSLNTLRSNAAYLGPFFEKATDVACAEESESQLNTFSRTISFRGVSFSYHSGPRISYADITIRKGVMLGISGRSGSGKSTFIDLLTGLITPQDGFIYIDDVPLREITSAAWWRQISLVSQSTFILTGTVAENIAVGTQHDEIDYALLRKVVSIARLDECIGNLSDGLQTVIGDGGVGLSGGEAQRLALARALYKGSSIIVLDEPTSALDVTTQRELTLTLRSLVRTTQATLIVVSHSVELLNSCDFIYEI